MVKDQKRNAAVARIECQRKLLSLRAKSVPPVLGVRINGLVAGVVPVEPARTR